MVETTSLHKSDISFVVSLLKGEVIGFSYRDGSSVALLKQKKTSLRSSFWKCCAPMEKISSRKGFTLPSYDNSSLHLTEWEIN